MENKKRFYWLVGIFFLVTIITYSNHFDNGFHFDDSHTIQNNAYIRNIGNIPLFFKDGSTFSSLPSNQSYRPLLTTFFAFNYWLAGDVDNRYFHVTIFLFFILQCVLMYFVFLKIINSSIKNHWNNYFALFTVAWYALHTANAETINYICASSDSLSTFFVILSLFVYAYFPDKRKFFVYLLPLLGGLLIKQTVIVFPAILFFYILFFENDGGLNQVFKPVNFRKIKTSLINTIPSLIFCGILYFVITKMTPSSYVPGGSISVFNYLITQPFVILHYFSTFFLPISLSADTDWGLITSVSDFRFLVGSFFILAMIVFAIITSRRKETRPAAFGVLFFFFALLPTSSFIPLAEVMNDHRIFFPFVGLVLSVSSIVYYFVFIRFQSAIEKNNTIKIFCIFGILLLLELYAIGTYQRNEVWDTEESLWYDVTIKSPNNGRGLMNYGLTQMNIGNYESAEKYFEAGLEKYPYYSYLYINYGIVKAILKDNVKAEQSFKRAVELDGTNPETNFYYGRFLNDQQRSSEAIPFLNKTIEVSPSHIYAMNLLMEINFKMNKCNELKKIATRVLSIQPNNPTALDYLKKCSQ